MNEKEHSLVLQPYFAFAVGPGILQPLHGQDQITANNHPPIIPPGDP